MPREVVVDGTDGAGKTTFVAHLATVLRSLGHTVEVHAPYREREVYPLWDTAPVEAAAVIAATMQRRRAAAASDVLLWDRGWPTAFVSTDDADARALFALPDLTVLLLSTQNRTRAKAAMTPGAGVWVTDEGLVERYHRAYYGLLAPAGHRLLRFVADDDARFDVDTMTGAVRRALDV